MSDRPSSPRAGRPSSSRGDGIGAGAAGGVGGTTPAGGVEGGGGGDGGVVGVACASARDKAAASPLPSATARISYGLVPSRPRTVILLSALSEPCTRRCAATTSA